MAKVGESTKESIAPDAEAKTGVIEEEEIEPIFVGKTCTQCRIAKVKCDKHQPCARCLRRGYECCAQERGPGRPPSTNVGSKMGAKKASKSSLSGRKAKRRRGKQAKEEEQPQPDHEMGAHYPSGMYQMPGFPSQGQMPGHFGMQYVVPPNQQGFVHPKSGGPSPHQMRGPIKQQHPYTSNSKLLAQQFISKVTAGSLTKDKVHDVVAYLSDLAVKRKSSFLAQKVLEAIAILESESALISMELSPQALPSKELNIITTLSNGVVDPQDEVSDRLRGANGGGWVENHDFGEKPKYLTPFVLISCHCRFLVAGERVARWEAFEASFAHLSTGEDGAAARSEATKRCDTLATRFACC